VAKPLIAVDAIFDKALLLLDEGGVEGLSARNLAAALKCSTRTLYQQVGKKDELIGQLFAHYFAGLQLEFHQEQRWQDTAYSWAGGLRTALLAHPNLSRLITAEHRAPIADYTSELLKQLLKAGFPQELALRSCRVLVNVALALSLSELSTPSTYPAEKRRSSAEIRFEDMVVAKEATSKESHAPEVFENAIRWTISGIEKDLTANNKGIL
jgi:AcrR family transcriptional regulator